MSHAQSRRHPLTAAPAPATMRAMRRLLTSLLLLIAAPLAAAERRDVLHVATCPQQAAEYLATVRDTVVLDRQFFDPKQPEEPQIREGIRQQLKYFWGWFRTHKETYAQQHIVVGAEEPEIWIVGQRTVPYGRDLVVDWHETAPEMQIADPYTRRAVQRGVTRRDDGAVEVQYEARFPLAMCGQPRPEHSTLAFALPRDPWLMHWLVPRRDHRLVRYNADQAVTNPCVDDDYADLPHPFYYWYDWLPERHGRDAEGKPFDCRNLLKPGVDYFARTAALTRVTTPLNRLDALRQRLGVADRPLQATVVIGVLEHEWPHFDYPALAAALGSGTTDLAQKALAARKGSKPHEYGESILLKLLADLPSVITPTRYRASVQGDYLRVDVDGTLDRSGRALKLHAFVGVTDVLGPTPPHHWPILRAGLKSDDIVVYAGHSGVGENFRLQRILADAKLSAADFAKEFKEAPFQLIAFLSCYSYMYFGRDLEAAAQHAAGRAFVYTGSPYSKGDRGTLAILDLVDQALAKGTQPLTLHNVADEDFLLLKEVLPLR